MAFRNVIIRHKAHLSVQDKRLSIRHQEGQHYLAFEDTQTVMLESQSATITSQALSSLATNNCALLICDVTHLPVGILLPFHTHSTQMLRIQEQLSLTQARSALLWKKIVMSKIINQSNVLRLVGRVTDEADLIGLIEKVKPGDPQNVEAHAAQVYFSQLFGKTFTREQNNGWNAALNYGYSLVRSSLARNLAAFGLLPSLGIFHHNQFNNFNLADDLIEPYRPFIDLWVVQHLSQDELLSPTIKEELVGLLHSKILVDGKYLSMEYATEKTVESFITFLKHPQRKKIKLPSLL